MKKILYLFLILACLLAVHSPGFSAGEIPRRPADEVEDVYEPYTASEWIISPDEEDEGDQNVSNAPECDIRGVIACYDVNYLRVDILLHNSL
ncbi:MAG: hypothetical protein ACM3WV_09555 [Bacillota bacterium]